jgi:hypothetical protein
MPRYFTTCYSFQKFISVKTSLKLAKKIQDTFPNWKQRGSTIFQSIILTVIVLLLPVNLGKSLVTTVVVNLTSRKFITNVFHQLWNFLGSLLIQNLGDFTVHPFSRIKADQSQNSLF